MYQSIFNLFISLMLGTSLYAYEADPNASQLSVKNEGIDFTQPEASNSIKKMLDDIQNMTPMQYPEKINQYRDTFENYVEYKKGVCGATYSTMVLDDKGAVKQGGGSGKLSKEERNLCIKELKEMQISFINNMYHIRKKYLDFLHETRLKELKVIKDSAINELMKGYKK